jgi:catechol 2,3-dioxygenase-like lactoylglutathione lyase family enzyme
MTSRITYICIDAADPPGLADFWCSVLGWQVVEQPGDGVRIAGADGTTSAVDFLPVTETKTVKNRLHFDLRADGANTSAELRRLLGLGATRVDVGQPAAATWAVLADPEGNEFCLLADSANDFTL